MVVNLNFHCIISDIWQTGKINEILHFAHSLAHSLATPICVPDYWIHVKWNRAYLCLWFHSIFSFYFCTWIRFFFLRRLPSFLVLHPMYTCSVVVICGWTQNNSSRSAHRAYIIIMLHIPNLFDHHQCRTSIIVK